MGPENSEEADFLARQPTWVRKILQGDYALSPEESAEMQQANWPEVFGVAQDQYRVLLKRHPEKLREYRKLQKRLGAASGLWGVPSVPSGAPRQDALAREARGLEQAGLSQSQIAASLNSKYPNRKDRKGNKKPFTAESVRKLLDRRRGTSPDKT
jgi:hypothetical protein